MPILCGIHARCLDTCLTCVFPASVHLLCGPGCLSGSALICESSVTRSPSHLLAHLAGLEDPGVRHRHGAIHPTLHRPHGPLHSAAAGGHLATRLPLFTSPHQSECAHEFGCAGCVRQDVYVHMYGVCMCVSLYVQVLRQVGPARRPASCGCFDLAHHGHARIAGRGVGDRHWRCGHKLPVFHCPAASHGQRHRPAHS